MKAEAVVVVDDDREIREVFTEALSLEGYIVLSAKDGLHALEVLKTVNHRCLILLDLNMPNMDGKEFISQYKSICIEAPLQHSIVVMSAALESRAFAKKESLEFLPKPISLDTLLSTVGRYCEIA